MLTIFFFFAAEVLEVLFAEDGSLRVKGPSSSPTISSSELTVDTSQSQPQPLPQPQPQPQSQPEPQPEPQPRPTPQLPQPQPRPTATVGSNGAKDEEKDWSHVSEVNNAMNLWCGATISEASDNCGRNGYNCPEGICPTNDLKCFMLFDKYCEVAPSTPPPSSEPTRTPSATPTETSSMKPSTTAYKSAVKVQNYCAKRHADLKTGCFTAPTCNDGVDPPCPEGTYCWGNVICTEETQQPSLRPSNAPSSSPIASFSGICATNYPHLQKTCWNAPPCSNDNPCSDGQKCFENIDCNFVSPKVPAPTSKNPTLSPSKSSSGNSDEEVINGVNLYCAVSERELEKSCSTARRCVDELCPLGMLCIPYDCERKEGFSTTSSEPGTNNIVQSDNKPTSPVKDNSHELCPDFFVGYHTRANCNEYFECNNGQIGPMYSCGQGYKFEKVSGKCHGERWVNQYCYGIDASSVSDSSNAEPNASIKPKCRVGYTGWDAKPGCKQYFWCSNGNEGASLDCGKNLLFDLELELCNFADDVNCPYEIPTTSPTKSKPVTPAPSPKVVSETDGFADFYKLPTNPPINRGNNAIPPWLEDIRITANDGVASAFSLHFVCCMISLLSALHFLEF